MPGPFRPLTGPIGAGRQRPVFERGETMRRGGFLAAVFLLFGGLETPAASAQTDAVAVARALIDAMNAHNVAAAVDLFSPGAAISLPTGALVTRAELEQWQRELAAGNFRAEITPTEALTLRS